MKPFYLLTLAFFLTTSAFADKITLTKVSADWTDPSAWSLNRLPADGDNIVIPAGYIVTLDKQVTLNNVVLVIAGTLRLDNGELNLDNTSKIILTSSGLILGDNSSDWVKIGGTFKFRGQQGIQTGPAFADYTTGSAPVSGFAMSTSLPVTFTSFYASKSNNNVNISWSTAQEFNNDNFQIEKSTDGLNWNVISVVTGAGNSSTPKQYSYTDKNISAAIVYYRIHQVDINGLSAYTSVRVVRMNGVTPVTKVYSNSKNVTVEFNKQVENNFTVRVLNMTGQIIAQQNYQQSAYKIVLNTNNANTGIYIVQVTDGKDLAESTKIIL